MNKKTILSVATSTLVSVLAVTGVAYAASINATSQLGGNTGDDFEFDGTGRFNSVYIGKQDEGGVTFFNGTIINSTTNSGVDNPVTFGDDIRVDGQIWRGSNSGPAGANGEGADVLPVVINDDFQVKGAAIFNGSVAWAEATSYLQIPGSAFSPVDPTATTSFVYTSGALDRNAQAGSAGTYLAPVSLPHGAKITNLEIRANDTDAASKVEFKLYRTKADYSSELLATVGTTDAYSGGDTTVNTDTDQTVDNSIYSYYITATPENQSNKVYDVKFTYTFTRAY